VADIGLADGNGLALAETLRPQFPDLPVLLTSGRVLWDRIVAARQDPMPRYFAKPFTVAELMTALHEILLG
jgi:CheY-like chemotaxis protein